MGLTVWRGFSTRGQLWKDTSSMHTHFTNLARPTECDLASVVRSQHRPGLSLPALGYVARCSTVFGYFPDRRCKLIYIFGKITPVLSDNIKTTGNRLLK